MRGKMTEHRTLMLEPQWHPIRWAKDNVSEDAVILFCIFFDVVGSILVGVFTPRPLKLWHWWRFALLGIANIPLMLLILGIILVLFDGIMDALKWLRRHPPVKVKTRWP